MRNLWLILPQIHSMTPDMAYDSLCNICMPIQNGHHLIENVFENLFPDKNCCVSIQISPKFVPDGSKWQQVSIDSDNDLRKIGDQP